MKKVRAKETKKRTLARDIVNVAEDEDLGIQPEQSEKLEHLMKKVRAKETKKRTLASFQGYSSLVDEKSGD
ncbi:hypothetical protein AAES_73009 [Amazona aestiva]|uniref:Ku70/Ku80 N-terminal alpha/beta domain-containing protein n=1 Tax=Amazona aestiva TaxID=12930 RepID=A0A0Q3MI30_AMAAE|nr:hypothetical protein AAES_73009 [Amazona aestiva]